MFEKNAKAIESTKSSNHDEPRHKMEIVDDGENPGKRKRSFCPAWPSFDEGEDVLLQFSSQIWNMLDNNPGNFNLVEFLKFFINNSWLSRNSLIFKGTKDLPAAQEYLALLRELHIPKNQLNFFFYDMRERSKIRRKWRDGLGLTWRDEKTFLNPRNPDSPGSLEWLRIEPIKSSREDRKNLGSYGFRFLLVMAAICYIKSNDNQIVEAEEV